MGACTNQTRALARPSTTLPAHDGALSQRWTRLSHACSLTNSPTRASEASFACAQCGHGRRAPPDLFPPPERPAVLLAASSSSRAWPPRPGPALRRPQAKTTAHSRPAASLPSADSLPISLALVYILTTASAIRLRCRRQNSLSSPAWRSLHCSAMPSREWPPPLRLLHHPPLLLLPAPAFL